MSGRWWAGLGLGGRSGSVQGGGGRRGGAVVDRVASGCSVGVDPGGWGPERDAVVDVHGPAVLVERAVVEAADQGHVVQVGGAAGGPFGDVMDLGPGGRAIAAGEGAAAVPGGEGEALAAGGEALAGAVGQDPAGVVEDHRQHLGLAGDGE